MSALEQQLAEYVAVRRAMGYKLERAGLLLAQFTGWLAYRDATTITTELALAWATLPAGGESNSHRQRLSAVRGFAAHLPATDPAHELPAAALLAWLRGATGDHIPLTALAGSPGTRSSSRSASSSASKDGGPAQARRTHLCLQAAPTRPNPRAAFRDQISGPGVKMRIPPNVGNPRACGGFLERAREDSNL